MDKVLLNDQIVQRDDVRIDIEDRGYQFGDGVYEVIRVYGGVPFLLHEHLERLERSAREIMLPIGQTSDALATQLKTLIRANELLDGIIYLQVSRGTAPRYHGFPKHVNTTLIAYLKEMPRPLAQLKEGVKAIVLEDIRWLRCDIKSLNLLGNVLAKQNALNNSAFEAIQHRQQTVTEGSASNVFMIHHSKVYTHPANNLILNGITRVKILELCKQLNIPYEEKAFTVDELYEADEVFISSTTSEITPVIEVEGRTIGAGIPGPLTVKLQQEFEALWNT